MIFLSYRRADAQAVTYAISERLARRLGADMIFLDVDNLRPGEDFPDELRSYISKSIVMLVIIGTRWLEMFKERQDSGVETAPDFVLSEIEQALQSNIHMIPLLIDHVAMPSAAALPNRIRGLAVKHAMRVALSDFRIHVAR